MNPTITSAEHMDCGVCIDSMVAKCLVIEED